VVSAADPLRSLKNCRTGNIKLLVRFEVFTTVTMKSAVFWDIKLNTYLTGSTLRLRTEPITPGTGFGQVP
jgi:hypothetical protein